MIRDGGGVVILNRGGVHEIFGTLAEDHGERAAVHQRGHVGDVERIDPAEVGVEFPRRGVVGKAARGATAGTVIAIDEVRHRVVGDAALLGPLAAKLDRGRQPPREHVFRVGLAGVDFGDDEAAFLGGAGIGEAREVGPIGATGLHERPFGGERIGARGAEIGVVDVGRLDADRAAAGGLVVVFRTREIEDAVNGEGVELELELRRDRGRVGQLDRATTAEREAAGRIGREAVGANFRQAIAQDILPTGGGGPPVGGGRPGKIVGVARILEGVEHTGER